MVRRRAHIAQDPGDIYVRICLDAARTTKAEPNPAVLAVPPVKQTLTREEWMAELSAYDWRAKQYLSGELEDAWESLDEDDTPPPSPLRGMRRL
jgi:hypothetical protein